MTSSTSGVSGWLVRACYAVMVIFGLLQASPAFAALTWQLRTGNATTNTQDLLLDSNQCPAKGPTAAYLGGVITNTGPATVNNIVVTASGFNANVYLAGGQQASQSIGSLGVGESIGVYWFVGYSCADGATATINAAISSSLGNQSSNVSVTLKKSLSANAGGNVLSAVLGPGAVVGQTVYFDAVYDFGGTAAGDEYYLQPSGGQTFNAACFRLVGSQIVSSNLNAATVGTTNRFYFVQPNRQSGNNYTIGVRYSFQYRCAGTSSTARPYADQTSGTQLKYTGNFDGTGSVSMVYPGATNPFTITKTVRPANALTNTSGNLTYTVTISNPSTNPSVLDKIVDILPAGMTYVGLASGSTVTIANSSSLPASGATGTLTFLGKTGSSYALPAGGSVTLVYTATRPPSAGSYVNSAQGHFGQATTAVAQATFKLTELIALAVTKSSSAFNDFINTMTNAKNLPGGLVEYTISVTNPNDFALDADSLVVADRTPAGLTLCVTDLGTAGSGPVSFADGTTASGLGYGYVSLASGADNLEFSNDNGATWTYVPIPASDGCDPAVTDFRIRPSGSMTASSSFLVKARYRIE